jgi:hypothetical protein
VLEDRLGLTKPSEPGGPTLAVGTTVGQAEHLQILHNTEEWLDRPLRKSHITWSIVAILWLFSFANVFGIVASVWLYYHPSSVQQSTIDVTSRVPRTVP